MTQFDRNKIIHEIKNVVRDSKILRGLKNHIIFLKICLERDQHRMSDLYSISSKYVFSSIHIFNMSILKSDDEHLHQCLRLSFSS